MFFNTTAANPLTKPTTKLNTNTSLFSLTGLTVYFVKSSFLKNVLNLRGYLNENANLYILRLVATHNYYCFIAEVKDIQFVILLIDVCLH